MMIYVLHYHIKITKSLELKRCNHGHLLLHYRWIHGGGNHRRGWGQSSKPWLLFVPNSMKTDSLWLYSGEMRMNEIMVTGFCYFSFGDKCFSTRWHPESRETRLCRCTLSIKFSTSQRLFGFSNLLTLSIPGKVSNFPNET
jgi:hypothetical protein